MPDNQNLQQPLKIGEELTQYKIEKVLGRGGFGITYLAMDLNLERQVVIKEFFPREQVMRSSGSKVQVLSSGSDTSLYQNSLKKFLAEGRTLAKFRHNNIALVLTAFPDNNTAYLVMEYNNGETLLDFIKKRNRPLDFTQIKKLFLPICKGLQALHKQDLLHLDIKPDNIYLPNKGEPYLIDFGGVRQFIASKDVSASFMVLTPGYAPAEQHSDTSKLGFYSDIYALGMTIYYTLTLDKKLPQSTDRQQSLFEGDDDPLPLLADSVITKNYPKDFIALVEQSIQPNRKHRLQTIDDLITVLAGKKLSKKSVKQQTKTNTHRPDTQLPIKNIIIGIVILALVGVGGWQLNIYQKQQAEQQHQEQQRQAEQQAERQRQAQQQAEKQRQAELKAEQKRQAELKAEQQRQAAQQAEKKRQAELKAEQKRQAELKAERQRQAEQQAEQQRQAEQQAEKKRQISLWQEMITNNRKEEWKNLTVNKLNNFIDAGVDVNAKGKYGITLLHAAARHNKNPEIIKALIKAGADVNAKGKYDGETPLHAAARHNKNPEIIKALIKAGADVNAKGKYDGETPLHAAAWNNKNPEVIKALIQAGADVNAKHEDGYTPLHWAARFNKNPEVIKALIQAGADVNAKNKYGDTPLHIIEKNSKLSSSDKAQVKRWLKNPSLVR